MPVGAGSGGLAAGSTFSLSGSLNLTTFLTGGLLAPVVVVAADFITVGGRPRVAFFGGLGWLSLSSGWATTFLGRPRVGFGAVGSSFVVSDTPFFAVTLARDAPVDAIAVAAAAGFTAPLSCSPTGFLGGRPRGRLACDACCSSSASSVLAFLLAAVLFVFAVRFDGTADRAFAAAVTILVDFEFAAVESGFLAGLPLPRRGSGGERIVVRFRMTDLSLMRTVFRLRRDQYEQEDAVLRVLGLSVDLPFGR